MEKEKNKVLPMTVVGQVKSILEKENVKARFSELLGENKTKQFLASIVNVVSSSEQLKKCDANSIVGSAFIASSYDLPIDSNLGFSALVPYEKSIKDDAGKWTKRKICQFQMMYKGFIQLAIRTGVYEKMNCAEVYEDEIVDYNPITAECTFVKNFKSCTQRKNREHDKVCGYYAWFKLKSGFVKELYMTKEEVHEHAYKYSQAYRYDLDKNKCSSRWSTDFDQMGKKTVIKMLLNKWGILSIDMQKAIVDDQKIIDEDGQVDYYDNIDIDNEVKDPFEQNSIVE